MRSDVQACARAEVSGGIGGPGGEGRVVVVLAAWESSVEEHDVPVTEVDIAAAMATALSRRASVVKRSTFTAWMLDAPAGRGTLHERRGFRRR